MQTTKTNMMVYTYAYNWDVLQPFHTKAILFLGVHNIMSPLRHVFAVDLIIIHNIHIFIHISTADGST